MVNYASNFIIPLDKGEATTLLAGVHGGCFVVFGPEDVHGIAGLKGRTVGVPGFGSGPDLLLSLMAAEVGLDPKKDLLDRRSQGEPEGFVHCRQGRRLPRLSAGPAGAARPAHRRGHLRHSSGPAVVAIFLLHARG